MSGNNLFFGIERNPVVVNLENHKQIAAKVFAHSQSVNLYGWAQWMQMQRAFKIKEIVGGEDPTADDSILISGAYTSSLYFLSKGVMEKFIKHLFNLKQNVDNPDAYMEEV